MLTSLQPRPQSLAGIPSAVVLLLSAGTSHDLALGGCCFVVNLILFGGGSS